MVFIPLLYTGCRPTSNEAFAVISPLCFPYRRYILMLYNITGAKSAGKGVADYPFEQPNASAASPDPKKDEEHQDIDIDELFGSGSPEDGNAAAEDKSNAEFDMNMPHQNEIDDEIADVDDSGDEVDKGPNAAEALRAQVNAEERHEQTSSSSSSSGSGSASSSRSGSASSSSSDSDGSDDDSAVNSI